MSQFSEPEGEEPCSASHVEHGLRCSTREAREHIEPREELPRFLGDCHRALEPGGVLRIIVPDAERYLQAYCQGGLEGS